MSDKFYHQLNSLIEYQGSGFGPALIDLILYGPIDQSKINEYNFNSLHALNLIYKNIYVQQIIPKMHSILTALTDNSINLQNSGKGIHQKLETIPFEDIRATLNRSYQGQFELDQITINGLNGSNELPENEYVQFLINNDLILSYRFKKENKLAEKYVRIFNKNELCPQRTLEFICEIANDPIHFWLKFNEYESEFDESKNSKLGKYTDLMLDDGLGFKFVDLKQTRSDQNLEQLVHNLSNLNIPGFKIINSRFNDHRKRNNSTRPGGLHFTLIDAGQTNFPMEVQVQGIKDLIFDKYGPKNHNRYDLLGKKSNESNQ